MKEELKAVIRRELYETLRTLCRAAAVVLLAYLVTEGIKLWARG